MKILRYKNLSKKNLTPEEKQKKKEERKKNYHDTAIGSSVVGGGLVGNTVHSLKVINGKTKFGDEEGRISKELLEEAEKKGVKVLDKHPEIKISKDVYFLVCMIG